MSKGVTFSGGNVISMGVTFSDPGNPLESDIVVDLRMVCMKCGHRWNPRVERPKSCPKCKRYDWSKG